LFAQDKAADKGAGPGEVSLLQNPMFLIIGLMILFFFVVILPAQRRQRREAESLMSNLKKNDEVVTASGIIGIVSNIKDGGDEVTLKIDDNARIRVLKSSIVRINKKEEAKDGAAGAAAPDTSIKKA
jgi:preprotein translocase subunit YajC